MSSRWRLIKAGKMLTLMSLLMMPAWAQDMDRFGEHDFPLASRSTPLGVVWTDEQGMTLYFNLRDRAETSTCTGACRDSWPPHLAESRHRQFPPQGFSVITRPDGDLQWAYHNQPLYQYVGDRVPGDITGHGMADRWWVAEPDASL
ncbi:MAG: hypothetical protein WEB07_03930 [Natronospirillum sp.]